MLMAQIYKMHQINLVGLCAFMFSQRNFSALLCSQIHQKNQALEWMKWRKITFLEPLTKEVWCQCLSGGEATHLFPHQSGMPGVLSVTITNGHQHSALVQPSRAETVAALRVVSSTFLTRELNWLHFGCNSDCTAWQLGQEYVVIQDANSSQVSIFNHGAPVMYSV